MRSSKLIRAALAETCIGVAMLLLAASVFALNVSTIGAGIVWLLSP